MRYFFAITIGYLLGSFSPSAIIAKKKNHDLRREGSGNLGATNTFLSIGKKYGFLVMGIDMLKAIIAYQIASSLLPNCEFAGLIGGGAAIVGHVFPIFLKFKGGKGLACFGGTVLAYDPILFLILMLITVALVLIFNYTAAMPISASLLFPIAAGLRDRSFTIFFVASVISSIITVKHWENLVRARNGSEMKVRDYLFHSEKEDDKSEEGR